MKIYVTSVFADDPPQAREFYTRVLGFEVKHDIPVGEHRWLTIVGRDNPHGTELLLERSEHPAVKPFKDALVRDGISAAPFQVDHMDAEFDRLSDLGVEFTQAPVEAGAVKMAVLHDLRAPDPVGRE